MSTISDYLDWRGDLTFAVSPFNEVDNYVISKIGTADFQGIVPPDGGVTVAEAAERLQAAGRTELNVLASKKIMPAILRLPSLPRYAQLTLWDYEAVFSADESEQFSALTVGLPDGSWYVSFRGTDDSLIGWKEDLMMGVEENVKAQLDAGNYLCRVAAQLPGPLIVGGHSKGGNLAVYAAATAPEEVQKRIVTVYNNDGPGFRASFLETEGYRRIRDRIVTLISQYSLVGTLLTQDRTVIVKSITAGVPAHDGFNWAVKGTSFVRCEALSRGSELFDSAMQTTLNGTSMEEARKFVDGVFEVLGATGADSIKDLTENKLRSAVSIVGALRQDTEVKRFVMQFLEVYVRELRGAEAEESETGEKAETKKSARGKRKSCVSTES